MGTRYGVLGQAAPAAATLTDAYLVPSKAMAHEVRVISCNRGASVAAVRISVAPNGEADALEQYIAYDKPVEPNDTVSSVELTLGESSVVRVRSDTGDISFTVNGIESTTWR